MAIARAFVTEPDIVLADEPTGNLDRTSGREILQLLRRACDEERQTTVMVTHDPFAASFADRVVFLRDGQVIRHWSPTDREGKSGEDGVQAIIDIMAELEF